MLDSLTLHDPENTYVIFYQKMWETVYDYQISCLTLSWRRPLSYRNHSTDLLCKSMDRFLYGNGLRHEKVKDSSQLILSRGGSRAAAISKMECFVTIVNGLKHLAKE